LLGKRIKELRKIKGLTQEALAEKVNIETGSLSAIESGRHFPSMPTIEKISKILDVEMKSFFDFEHLLPYKELIEEIKQTLGKVPEEKIIFIYKLIKDYK